MFTKTMTNSNPKSCKTSKICTSIVDKLSADDLSKLDFDSDFNFFPIFLNFGIVIPPVIKFDVDLDSSFISDMVDRSITERDNFFKADGVKLLSRTSRAASASNCSVSTLGQIWSHKFDVTHVSHFQNLIHWIALSQLF